MLFHNHHSQTPFASAYGYLIPGASLVLSLPTLAVDLVLISHAVTGFSIQTVIQISPFASAFGCLYIVFGPILGGLLCVTQRARAEQTYGSVHLLGFKMKRMNTIALYVAGLALGLLLGSGLLIILHTALTTGSLD